MKFHNNGTFIIDNTNQAHEVHTLGEFKDDCLQNITGSVGKISASYATSSSGAFYRDAGAETYSTQGSQGSNALIKFDASLVACTSTTTHGKQIGVTYLIKVL